MGGGTVWRGVTRLVTPAVRVAAATGSASCRFCKVNVTTQTLKGQSARLRSCSCAAETITKQGNVSQQETTSMWDLEEWEFAEEEATVDHFVFGSLPSKAEVEEASTELQDALRLGLVLPTSDRSASWTVGSTSFTEDVEIVDVSPPSDQDGDEGFSPTNSKKGIDWIEPPPISTGLGAMQVGGRNVVEAFHQFQHNPEVQGMVVSLATDPAVWDAVLANEKIQEFKRRIQGEKGFFAAKDFPFVDSKVRSNATEKPQNFFQYWQGKMSRFMELLRNIISGFFKAADTPVVAEEDGDFVDWTVKSCTMLALVVLSVVILKRLVIQAT